MESSETVAKNFRGLIDYAVRMTILNNESHGTIQEESDNQLLVDIFDDVSSKVLYWILNRNLK